MENKYPSSSVERYFDEFMEQKKKRLVEIPFRDLESLLEGQNGDHWDVCRRAFLQYLKDLLKEKYGIELRLKLDCRIIVDGIKQPSPMGELCSFRMLLHKHLVTLKKLMETEDFIKYCRNLA